MKYILCDGCSSKKASRQKRRMMVNNVTMEAKDVRKEVIFMRKLESLEQFDALKREQRVIFLFSADWCPDCRVIEPFLPSLETEFSEYQFFYVDRDDFIDLCSQLDIFGIPSFLAYSEGRELGRFVSKNRKTKEEIEEFINSL